VPRFAIAPLGLTTEGSTKFKLKGWKCYLKKLRCIVKAGVAITPRQRVLSSRTKCHVFSMRFYVQILLPYGNIEPGRNSRDTAFKTHASYFQFVPCYTGRFPLDFYCITFRIGVRVLFNYLRSCIVWRRYFKGNSYQACRLRGKSHFFNSLD